MLLVVGGGISTRTLPHALAVVVDGLRHEQGGKQSAWIEVKGDLQAFLDSGHIAARCRFSRLEPPMDDMLFRVGCFPMFWLTSGSVILRVRKQNVG